MAEDPNQDTPKLHIDSDWKTQAQQEKKRMAEQAKARSGEQQAGGGASGGAAGGMPPASFETLVSTLATQALFAMGAVPDPRTGQAYQNMDLARHNIDLLGVIEEKTKGNLTEDESTMLASTVYELRTRYVQMASGSRGGGT